MTTHFVANVRGRREGLQAEIDFMLMWRKRTGEQLRPANDWFSQIYNMDIEVKQTSYSLADLCAKRRMTINMSIMNKNHGDNCLIVIKFPEGWFYAFLKDIKSSSTKSGFMNPARSEEPDMIFDPSILEDFLIDFFKPEQEHNQRTN